MTLSLGIDIGTSKVALVLIGEKDRSLRACQTELTNAGVSPHPDFFEQDVEKIFSALDRAFSRLPQDLLGQVGTIGITGQMHGVVPWKSSTYDTGRLITWQDKRVERQGFLSKLHALLQESSTKPGFGVASLAWLAEHEPSYLAQFDRASTIHDFLAAYLCGGDAVTDPTNAMSWGCFDLATTSWKSDLLSRIGLSPDLFPAIVPTGSVAGRLSKERCSRWHLPSGIPVTTPLGDNQASLFATVEKPETELSLTLGTGGQLAAILSAEEYEAIANTPSLCQDRGTALWPFVDSQYLAVGASLCGGQAFGWLVDSFRGMLQELGMADIDRDQLYLRMNALAEDALESPLNICSSFLGERHDLERRGTISNIDLHNFTIGNIMSSLVRGTLENLREMLPPEVLSKRTSIVGSGNGLRRLGIVQALTERVFERPLRICDTREEAAQGAARLALRHLNSTTLDIDRTASLHQQTSENPPASPNS